MPTAEALSAYMGVNVSATRLDAVLNIVTAQVKSYTRGEGFTDDGPAEDLETVIYTVAARLVTNPAQVKAEGMGGLNVTHAAPGFTIPELFVLNRYRDRAR